MADEGPGQVAIKLRHDVAVRLTKAMEALSLSPRAYAKLMNTSYSWVNRVLNADEDLTIEEIAMLFWSLSVKPKIDIDREPECNECGDDLVKEEILCADCSYDDAPDVHRWRDHG